MAGIERILWDLEQRLDKIEAQMARSRAVYLMSTGDIDNQELTSKTKMIFTDDTNKLRYYHEGEVDPVDELERNTRSHMVSDQPKRDGQLWYTHDQSGLMAVNGSNSVSVVPSLLEPFYRGKPYGLWLFARGNDEQNLILPHTNTIIPNQFDATHYFRGTAHRDDGTSDGLWDLYNNKVPYGIGPPEPEAEFGGIRFDTVYGDAILDEVTVIHWIKLISSYPDIRGGILTAQGEWYFGTGSIPTPSVNAFMTNFNNWGSGTVAQFWVNSSGYKSTFVNRLSLPIYEDILDQWIFTAFKYRFVVPDSYYGSFSIQINDQRKTSLHLNSLPAHEPVGETTGFRFGWGGYAIQSYAGFWGHISLVAAYNSYLSDDDVDDIYYKTRQFYQ